MNNKNKGFAHIKLLIVIIVIIIICIFLSPIIKTKIDEINKKGMENSTYSKLKLSKIALAKQSMTNYIGIVESSSELNAIINDDLVLLTGTYETLEGNLINSEGGTLHVDVRGSKPENNFGTVELLEGKVVRANLKFDGIEILYDGEKVISKE